MAHENVFRFLAVRPSDHHKTEKSHQKKFPLISDTDEHSEFYTTLQNARAQDCTREAFIALAKGYQDSESYVARTKDLDFDVQPLFALFQKLRARVIEDVDLNEEIIGAYNCSLNSLVNSSEFKKTYHELKDTILCDSIVRKKVPRRSEEVVRAYKLMHILIAAAAKALPTDGFNIIEELVTKTIVSLPRISKLTDLMPEEATTANEPSDSDAPSEDREAIQQRESTIKDLATAHRELSRLALNEKAISNTKGSTSSLKRIGQLEKEVVELKAKCYSSAQGSFDSKAKESDKRSSSSTLGRNDFPEEPQEFLLTQDAVSAMSEGSQRALNHLRLDLTRVNPVKAVSLIEHELGYLNSLLSTGKKNTVLLALGGTYMELGKIEEALAGPSVFAHPKKEKTPELMFQAGIGDLLVVKQKLKAYELAEFAHVENVLARESRDREHRRLSLREEIITAETENEIEKEKDLQSTERHELQAEAEKTIKSQFELEAGLQITASFGPSLSLSSNLNIGYDTSTEETKRKAVSYSREVTEKASERIRQKIREEQRRRVLEEIEEINKHSVDNSESPEHVRGIYRWLNKIFDAQIYNYGQRMMFEFVVPEPAAYFLHALVDNPPEDMVIEKPEAPEYYGQPLKPENLTRYNYHQYVSQYKVTGAPELPSAFTVKTYVDKQEGGTVGHFSRATTVAIPPEFEAFGALINKAAITALDRDGDFKLMIGGVALDLTDIAISDYYSFTETYRGEISVIIEFLNGLGFSVGIDIMCSLTAESFTKWQHETYDAIILAYQRLKSNYEEQRAAMSIRKGVTILGRNPIENRRIEKEELKKLVLMMLRDTNDIQYGCMDSVGEDAEPVMHIDDALEAGADIRFFENAFEWSNIMYVFYPYFWGRKSRWSNALHLTDPDLDFAAFLKAGAARVQVPVRPGFEKAIAYYCQYKKIWEDHDPPLIDDELYVPIVDEISENLGKFEGDGIPYPEDSTPWEVTIPTSLVLVQNMEEVSEIRDIMTGNPVSITE